jgi:hypothetical protein
MDWLRRNRKKLAFGSAVAVATGYALYKVYDKSVSNLAHEGSAEAPESSRGALRREKDDHLTSDAEVEEVFKKLVKVTAKQGFSTWSPALKRELLESELNRVSILTVKLKELKASVNAKADKSGSSEAAKKDQRSKKDIVGEKLALWNELKNETFAQCVSVVWGISLLNVFLSVQLMIVARMCALISKPKDSSSNEEEGGMKYNQARLLLEEEMERLITHFMENNLREICSIATEASGKTLEPMGLKKKMTYQDVLSTLACISSTTEFQISQGGWCKTLMPKEDTKAPTEEKLGAAGGNKEEKEELLRQFHSNLKKVLGGQDFEFAVSMSARCISDILMNKCQHLFVLQSGHKRNSRDHAANNANSQEPAAPSPQMLPLAKVIPLVSTASGETVSDCDGIIEYNVSKLPEVIRASADAFSVHVSSV